MNHAAIKSVRILGTHGVPAAYGGFETAAENIGLYLAAHGWRVIVYCQADGTGNLVEDTWSGLERITIPVDPVTRPGWRGTSYFDWLSIAHACQFRDLCLTFGYNTGIYNLRQRLNGIPNVINMDGIEWSRARWGPVKQAILYVNERFACLFANHLIADHPEIERYLETRAPARKISTITYGAYPVATAPTGPVTALGLTPGRYVTLIARPIPENLIAELVEAFSRRTRKVRLVVLGELHPETDLYHRKLLALASDEVLFAGPIYDRAKVEAIRFHAAFHLHGHTVGGTNPSLVEALAAGNPILAHDNPYNRWVARDAALYFTTPDDIDRGIATLLGRDALRCQLSQAARARHQQEFTWSHVAGQYDQLLTRHLN